MKRKGWIGVDLDGTLAIRKPGDDPMQIGEPIGPMVRRVMNWLQQGRKVKIFTARMHPGFPPDPKAFKAVLDEWCLRHLGTKMEAAYCKDPCMDALWDNQCFHVESNTGRLIG